MSAAIALFLVGFVGILIILGIAAAIRAIPDWCSRTAPIIPVTRNVNKPNKNFVRKAPAARTTNLNLAKTPIGTSFAVQPPQNINSTQAFFQNAANGWVQMTLYHGTSNKKNFLDMASGGGGFIIGPRNSHGSGLYMTSDLQTAKGYTRNSGGVLVLSLNCPANQIIDYQSVINSEMYLLWSKMLGIGNSGDAITNYCINLIKKRFLKATDTMYVALSQKTSANQRVQFDGLSITGFLDANGNSIV